MATKPTIPIIAITSLLNPQPSLFSPLSLLNGEDELGGFGRVSIWLVLYLELDGNVSHLPQKGTTYYSVRLAWLAGIRPSSFSLSCALYQVENWPRPKLELPWCASSQPHLVSRVMCGRNAVREPRFVGLAKGDRFWEYSCRML